MHRLKNTQRNQYQKGRYSLMTLAVLGLILAGMTSASSIAAAAASNDHRIDKQLAAVLVKLDGNKDGRLSREEAQTIADTLFRERDISKNGSLEHSEYRGWLQKKRLNKVSPNPDDSTYSRKDYNELLTKRYNAADRDGDGKISQIEFAGWKTGKSLSRFLDPKPQRVQKNSKTKNSAN
ncbi:MAG: hypothetical protein ORO03_02900 [Alphaproteobacteria bacterium]|nr:hypothetical protein [Alphaproteobacteria bacterium]